VLSKCTIVYKSEINQESSEGTELQWMSLCSLTISCNSIDTCATESSKGLRARKWVEIRWCRCRCKPSATTAVDHACHTSCYTVSQAVSRPELSIPLINYFVSILATVMVSIVQSWRIPELAEE
jgi:hypothetical protein